MTEWDIFPFVGELRLKELEPPVVPEPPRAGEEGGSACRTCERPDEWCLWVDDDWRVAASPTPSAVPVVMLETRAHVDFADMSSALASTFGPMLQRLEATLLSTGKIGRVHFNRWGDGGSHCHIWVFGRPLGALQLLGTFLPVWTSMLPGMDADEWWWFLDAIGDGLEAGGGKRHLRRGPT